MPIMRKMPTTTRILTIKMLVFLSLMLYPLVFLSLALFFLVLLLLTLPFLVFLLLEFLFLILLSPILPLLVLLPLVLLFLGISTPRITPSDSLNHDFSSPFFYFLSHFCLSLFSFPYSTRSGSISHQNLDAHFCYTTPPSLFLMQVFKATLLLLEENYVVQHSISLLGISRK